MGRSYLENWSLAGYPRCPGHAGAKGSDRADKPARKATLTSGLLLGKSEALRKRCVGDRQISVLTLCGRQTDLGIDTMWATDRSRY